MIRTRLQNIQPSKGGWVRNKKALDLGIVRPIGAHSALVIKSRKSRQQLFPYHKGQRIG